MTIYTIADLHLSFNTNKPMDIFGQNWQNYEEKIKQEWQEKVKQDDLVILPGDFSWAMYLDETEKDFEFINNLPGKKILLKGNHDYWWTTVTSMRKYIQEKNFQNIDFLYNNSYEFDNKIIVGTRGWALSEEQEDIRLTKREVARLELSIKDGILKYGEDKEIIVFMHYPPLTKNYMKTEYTEYAKNLKPSARGELEITDLNKIYLANNALNVELLGQGFTWLDTGTHESLVDATNFVKTVETHQHRKIACLEEIAYLNGWISKEDVLEVYEVLKKNQYGQYLKDVLDGKYIEL